MHAIISDKVAAEAADHLRQHDEVLAPIIERVGPCTVRPHTDYYWELVDSIISQQLSVKAARSIEQRFQALFGSDVPAPEQILQKSVEELRAVGLSRPKANYIHDLAQHVQDGKLTFDKFPDMSNADIIRELTDVKGIGEWTAHMFLMFCLARTDILPVGDLGIRNGIRQLYGFEHAPSPEEITVLADRNHWHPYESIASWYVWKHLDNTPSL
jgi:DNA-3-methyladenine glycosylase II